MQEILRIQMMLNFNNFIMNLKQWKICYKNNNYIYIYIKEVELTAIKLKLLL